ncbi:hypothetical protein [Methylobacterium sp. Leaf117]|uniref:hypothetical protein n=1 Tax=Methylobacterium sp. Leaf117 TaxID=1736260 RepID=UPI0006FD01BE|nr:hypothetical protein [Methylobacterium sp. Leaf117]KQP80326.1 hypothetical protein ASF57_18270 [Methylobacterium sp. Leaf117]
MTDVPSERSSAAQVGRRPDEYHVYVRHAGVTYFLADDGTFVPEQRKGRKFMDIEDAHAVLNRIADGRELGKDEPGIVRNAWRWVGE